MDDACPIQADFGAAMVGGFGRAVCKPHKLSDFGLRIADCGLEDGGGGAFVGQ